MPYSAAHTYIAHIGEYPRGGGAKQGNVLLTGKMTGQNVKGNVQVSKNNFKKRLVTPTIFFVMKWKWQAYSTRD